MGLKHEVAASEHTHGKQEDVLAVPNCEEVVEMVAALESLPKHVNKPSNPDSIPISSNKLLPSVIQAPSLELKSLPSHLKYVFLGDQETLQVIVSSTLMEIEEEKLVRVLKEYKTAIGWTLADIKGTSLSARTNVRARGIFASRALRAPKGVLCSFFFFFIVIVKLVFFFHCNC